MKKRRRWQSRKVIKSKSGLVTGNTHVLCGLDAVDAFENRAFAASIAEQERQELAARRIAAREQSKYGWAFEHPRFKSRQQQHRAVLSPTSYKPQKLNDTSHARSSAAVPSSWAHRRQSQRRRQLSDHADEQEDRSLPHLRLKDNLPTQQNNYDRILRLREYIEESHAATTELQKVSELLPPYFHNASKFRRPLTTAAAQLRESSIKLQKLLRKDRQRGTGKKKVKSRIKLGSIKAGRYSSARAYSATTGRSTRDSSHPNAPGSRVNECVLLQQRLLARTISTFEGEVKAFFEHQKEIAKDDEQVTDDDPFSRLGLEQLAKQDGSLAPLEPLGQHSQNAGSMGVDVSADNETAVSETVSHAIHNEEVVAAPQATEAAHAHVAQNESENESENEDDDPGLYDDGGDDEAMWSPQKLHRVMQQREAALHAKQEAAAASAAAAEAAAERARHQAQLLQQQRDMELKQLQAQRMAIAKIQQATKNFLVRRHSSAVQQEQRAARDAAKAQEHTQSLLSAATRIVDVTLQYNTTRIQTWWRSRRHSADGAKMTSGANRHQRMRDCVKSHFADQLAATSSSTDIVATSRSSGVLEELKGRRQAAHIARAKIDAAKLHTMMEQKHGAELFEQTKLVLLRQEHEKLRAVRQNAAIVLQAAARRHQQKQISTLTSIFDSIGVFVELQVLRLAHANAKRMASYDRQQQLRDAFGESIRTQSLSDMKAFDDLRAGAAAAVKAEEKKIEARRDAATFIQRALSRCLKAKEDTRKRRSTMIAAAKTATHGFAARRFRSLMTAARAAIKLQARWRARSQRSKFEAHLQEKSQRAKEEVAASLLQRQARRRRESKIGRDVLAQKKHAHEEGLLTENPRLTKLADKLDRAEFQRGFRKARSVRQADQTERDNELFRSAMKSVTLHRKALKKLMQNRQYELAASTYRKKQELSAERERQQADFRLAQEAAHAAADELEDIELRRKAHEAADNLKPAEDVNEKQVHSISPPDSDFEQLGITDDEERWLQLVSDKVIAIEDAVDHAERKWGSERVRRDEAVQLATREVSAVQAEFADIRSRADEARTVHLGVQQLQSHVRGFLTRAKLAEAKRRKHMMAQASLLEAAGEGVPLADGILEAERHKFNVAQQRKDDTFSCLQASERKLELSRADVTETKGAIKSIEHKMQGVNQRMVVEKSRLGLATASALIMETFVAFDTDMDGYIDMEELGHLFDTMEFEYTHEYLVDIVERFDTDHNGVIDLIEFQEMMKVVMKELKSQGEVATQAVDAIVSGAMADDSSNPQSGFGDGLGISRKATVLASRFTNSVWKQEIDHCKKELNSLAEELREQQILLEQREQATAEAADNFKMASQQNAQACDEFAMVEKQLDTLVSGATQRKIMELMQVDDIDIEFVVGAPSNDGTKDSLDVAIEDVFSSRESRYRDEQVARLLDDFSRKRQKIIVDLESLDKEIAEEKESLHQLRESVDMHKNLAAKLLRKKDALVAKGGGPSSSHDAVTPTVGHGDADDFKEISILAIQHEKMLNKVAEDSAALQEATHLNNLLMSVEDLRASFVREEVRHKAEIRKKQCDPIDEQVLSSRPIRPPTGYNAILIAAKSGSQPILELLLSLKASLYAQGRDGHHALSLAATHGHSAAVSYLLTVKEKEAEQLEKQAAQLDLLHKNELESGRFEQAKNLVARRDELLAIALKTRQSRWPANNDRRTILHIVCQQGLAAVTAVLDYIQRLPTVQDVRDVLNARGYFGMTAMHECVRSNHINTLREICQRFGPAPACGAQQHPLLLEIIDDTGRTPLHCAIQAGLYDAVDVLLAAGADPNTSCRLPEPTQNHTLEGLSCYSSALRIQQCMSYLAGPQPSTPLFMAVIQGDVRVVSRLIEAGAQLCCKLQNRNHLLKAAAAVAVWRSREDKAKREQRRQRGYMVAENADDPEIRSARAAAAANEPDSIFGGYDELKVAVLLGNFAVMRVLIDSFHPSLREQLHAVSVHAVDAVDNDVANEEIVESHIDIDAAADAVSTSFSLTGLLYQLHGVSLRYAYQFGDFGEQAEKLGGAGPAYQRLVGIANVRRATLSRPQTTEARVPEPKMSFLEDIVGEWLSFTDGVDFQSTYGLHFNALVALVCTQLQYHFVLANSRAHDDVDETGATPNSTVLRSRVDGEAVYVPPMSDNLNLPRFQEWKLWYAQEYRTHLLPCARKFGRFPTTVIEKYLRNGLELRDLIQKENITGRTCLRQCPNDVFLCAETGDVAGLIFHVTRCGTDPNAVSEDDGYTALLMASLCGHATAIRALLLLGANPNYVSSTDGVTALTLAAYLGHTDAVSALLHDDFAPVDSTDVTDATSPQDRCAPLWMTTRDGRVISAIMLAAQRGHRDSLRVLLSVPRTAKFANCLSSVTEASTTKHIQNTALIMASSFGHVDCVAELCACFAINVDCTNSKGMSALYVAAVSGHSDCVEVLVDAGANVSLPSTCGATPLLAAVLNGDEHCVRLLVEAGATSTDGQLVFDSRLAVSSEVSVAAFMGDFNVLVQLLGHGDGQDTKPNDESAQRLIQECYGSHITLNQIKNAVTQANSSWSNSLSLDVAGVKRLRNTVQRMFQMQREDKDMGNGSTSASFLVSQGYDGIAEIADAPAWNFQRLLHVFKNFGFQHAFKNSFRNFVALWHFRLSSQPVRVLGDASKELDGDCQCRCDGIRLKRSGSDYIVEAQFRTFYPLLTALRSLSQSKTFLSDAASS